MLTQDHFLRRLPIVLDRELRLRVEALVFSYDAMSLSLKRLQQHAEAFSLDAALTYRLEMLSDAWQIVEHAHASIVLINRLPEAFHTDSQEDYRRKFQVARQLRNEIARGRENSQPQPKESAFQPVLWGAEVLQAG